MGELLSKIVEMSVMGSVVILITMLARFLLRKRSKRFIMILWSVVAMRLLVPISIESSLSIFNYLPLKTNTVSTIAQIQDADLPDLYSDPQALTAEDAALPEIQDDYRAEMSGITEMTEENLATVDSLPDIKTVLAVVWLAGVMGITGYCSVRYILLKRKLKDARNTGDNVFVSDKITAPFVFGFFAPGIYLPDNLENSEKDYVLLHEKTHIRHGDQISKIIGMFVVAVHWFNPLVWLAYALFEQDIEMSCDECVVADMDADVKKAYTMSIVSYAKMSNNKRYLVTPLGFSKVNFSKTEVTNRVKNIINYKKGKTLTAAVIIVALLFVAMVCGLNSKTNADEADSINEPSAEITVTIETTAAETTAAETTAESKETDAAQSMADTIAEAMTPETSEPEAAEETTAETTASSEETSAEPAATSETDGTPEEDKSSGPDSNSNPGSAEDQNPGNEPGPGSDADSSDYIETPAGRVSKTELAEKERNYKETSVSKTLYVVKESEVRTGPGYYAFDAVSTLKTGTEIEVIAETDSGWYKLDSGYYILKSNCGDKLPPAPGDYSDFASYVKSFIGCQYVFGNADVNGFDTSGFVMYCYMDYYGISLPHGSNSIWKFSGREVSRDELQVGDIICYDYGDYCGHVAIYIGDGQVVHASSTKGCVCCDDLDMMNIIGIKRIVNN